MQKINRRVRLQSRRNIAENRFKNVRHRKQEGNIIRRLAKRLDIREEVVQEKRQRKL